jgi:hypothetical protein
LAKVGTETDGTKDKNGRKSSAAPGGGGQAAAHHRQNAATRFVSDNNLSAHRTGATMEDHSEGRLKLGIKHAQPHRSTHKGQPADYQSDRGPRVELVHLQTLDARD